MGVGLSSASETALSALGQQEVKGSRRLIADRTLIFRLASHQNIKSWSEWHAGGTTFALSDAGWVHRALLSDIQEPGNGADAAITFCRATAANVASFFSGMAARPESANKHK